MATKKKKSKPSFLTATSGPDSWTKVIQETGLRMRSELEQRRINNVTRANAIRDLPLEDMFHEVATQTTSPVSPVLREMIEEGAKDGLRDSPDPLTVALIRAAHFWYVAAQRHTGGHE